MPAQEIDVISNHDYSLRLHEAGPKQPNLLLLDITLRSADVLQWGLTLVPFPQLELHVGVALQAKAEADHVTAVSVEITISIIARTASLGKVSLRTTPPLP